MAELDVGTMQMTVTVDGEAAIRELDRVEGAAVEAGRGIEQGVGGGAADARGDVEALGDAGQKAGQQIESGAKDADDALEKAGQSAENLGKQLSSAGAKMTALVTAPVLAAMAAAVNGASDLTETVSKTEVVFDRLSEKVLAWSENSIDAMGLAQGSALEYAATFGDMGKGMGLALDQATDMSMALTQLAADLASFKNIDTATAAQKLNAIYTGETEGLKSLGIVMTQTNLQAFAASRGIDKAVSSMTQAEQVMLRYQYVMAATADAQGDFARTGDSLANQSRKLGQTVKELGESFGSQLVPMVTSAVSGLQQWVQHINELDSGTKNLIISVLAVAAAIGPLLLVGGKVLTFIASLKAALAALAINPVVMALAAVAAVAAGIAAMNGALNRANRESNAASDSYDRMKKKVEAGVKGKVSIDKKELDELEIPDGATIHITAEGQQALDAAAALIATLQGDEYKGMITLDGDPDKAETRLAEIAALIDDTKGSVTIDGDGNAVIGDAGLVQQIQTAIDDLEGMVVVTENPVTAALLNARLAALRLQLQNLIASVSIDVSESDQSKKNREAFEKWAEGLEGNGTFKATASFDIADADLDLIDDYKSRLMEAQGVTTDFSSAVKAMNEIIDQQLSEALQAMTDNASAEIDAIMVLYNSGEIDRETAQEMYVKRMEQFEKDWNALKEQADEAKKANEVFKDGNHANDYQAGFEQRAKLSKGVETIDSGTVASAIQELAAAEDEAVASGELAIPQMAALKGMADAAAEGYATLTDGLNAYSAAMAEAEAERETSLAMSEREGQIMPVVQDAMMRYVNILNQGRDAQEAYSSTVSGMGDDLTGTEGALDAFAAAITGADGELITDMGELEATWNALSQRMKELPDAPEKAEQAYAERAEQAKEQLTQLLQQLQESDLYANSSEAQGLMDKIGGVDGLNIPQEQLDLITQYPEMVEQAVAAIENGDDPVSVLNEMMSKAAPQVEQTATDAVQGAADAAASEGAAGGEDAGAQFAAGVARGVESGEGEVGAAARRLGAKLMSELRGELEIQSPSKKARDQIGVMIPRGIAAGVEEEIPATMVTVRQAASRLIAGAKDVIDPWAARTPEPAAAGAPIDYDAMGEAMSGAMRRVSFRFGVNGRDLAAATREDNARQLALQTRSVANRYGG